jgi:hypothetical protein
VGLKEICLAAAALLALSQTALGVPTSVGSGAQLSNDTDSQVYPDTDVKTRLWVLPPTHGKAGEPKLSMELASTLCDSMNDLIQSARSYSKQVLSLAKLRENILLKLEELTDRNTSEAIELYSQTEAINKLIIEAYQRMNDLTKGDARNHGGTLLVPYTHDQEKNIAKVRSQNPSYSDVREVETHNARLYFAAPGSVQDGLDLSLMPIISSYGVQGVDADALATSPAQVARRIDVTLSLTRMGACLMGYPHKFGQRTAPKFGMTLIYEYPFVFKTAVRASYNLKNIYQFVTISHTKGGFFSSKSWSETLEANWGESALKFHWSEDDPESKITIADRVEAEKSVKAFLLASLDSLILAKADVTPAQVANPGPHGATVLADSLEKECADNDYCAAASISLRTLDAVFGRSSMSTEIEKKLDVTATYSNDTFTARYVSQGISYSGD